MLIQRNVISNYVLIRILVLNYGGKNLNTTVIKNILKPILVEEKFILYDLYDDPMRNYSYDIPI